MVVQPPSTAGEDALLGKHAACSAPRHPACACFLLPGGPTACMWLTNAPWLVKGAQPCGGRAGPCPLPTVAQGYTAAETALPSVVAWCTSPLRRELLDSVAGMTALTGLTLCDMPADQQQLERVLSALPSLQRLRLRDPQLVAMAQAVCQRFPHLKLDY